jgi:flagellar basal body P-ring formation protein FlgA
MIYRGFLACALLAFGLPAWSQPYEDNVALIARVQAHLTNVLANEYKGVEPDNLKVKMGPLDSRLRLSLCENDIEQTINSPRPYGNNLSVKVHCPSSKPWTVYVPARVDTLAKVAVALKNLERGDVISPGDVELSLMNTAQVGYGYITQSDQIVGMELKRGLPLGSPIRLVHLKAPEVVSKGEKVTLEAGIGGLTVVTNARAMTAGKMGEQIQVRNIKSNRIVEARVVAPGRVRVAL